MTELSGEFRYRVHYEDTDLSGVMHHPRYLVFAERARTDFLRARGFIQQKLLSEQGVAFTLTEISARYFSPARLDDELIVSVNVEKLGRATVHFDQQLLVGPRLCAELRSRVASVRYPDFRPTALPPALRQALATYVS